MKLAEYIEATAATAIYPGAGEETIGEMAYLTLGLNSKVGEVSGVIHEAMANRGNLPPELLCQFGEAAGAVLWMWCRLVLAVGLDPVRVAGEDLSRRVDFKINEARSRAA